MRYAVRLLPLITHLFFDVATPILVAYYVDFSDGSNVAIYLFVLAAWFDARSTSLKQRIY